MRVLLESWLFLGIILIIALIAKNQSLIIATAFFILLIKLIPQTDKLLEMVQLKGINWGVTIITALY